MLRISTKPSMGLIHLLRTAISDSNAFNKDFLPNCAACNTLTATSWSLKVPAHESMY